MFGLAAAPNLRRAGIGVAIANIVFTVVAVVVVAADALPLTATGIGATLATGAYTALIGYLQYLGVRRLQA